MMLRYLRRAIMYLTGKISISGHELCRDEGENFRSVRVRANDDEFTIDTQDMGPATEQAWGDSDYEFWTIVPRDEWGKLLMAFSKEFLGSDPRAPDYGFWTDVPRQKQRALLMAFAKEFFANDCNATDRVADICRKHGVNHTWGSWA